MNNYLLLRLAFLDFLERVRRLPPACGRPAGGSAGLPAAGPGVGPGPPGGGPPAPGAPGAPAAPAAPGFGAAGVDIKPPIYLTIE